jgi:hypothetical protein
MQGTGAAHAAHHLVQDQQDAVPVAQLAHALQVARHRHERPGSRAHHGLRDEGDDGLGSQAVDGLGQLGHQPLAVLFGGFVRPAVAVLVARRDMGDLDQQRCELRPPPGIAAHGQRPQRVAMVALAPRDEVAALRLADLDEVLARHLQRGLDGLGAAADEVGVADADRRVRHQVVRQRLGHLGGEEAGVRIGHPVDLGVHGLQHVRMAVTEAGHRRAAGGVDVLATLVVGDDAAPGRDGTRQVQAELAVDDAAGRGGSHAEILRLGRSQ